MTDLKNEIDVVAKADSELREAYPNLSVDYDVGNRMKKMLYVHVGPEVQISEVVTTLLKTGLFTNSENKWSFRVTRLIK